MARARRVWQRVGLVLLAVATVALCYLAVTRTTGEDPDSARDEPTGSPTASPTAAASDDPTASPEPTETAAPTETAPPQPQAPVVPDQRRKDFAAGEGLPDGAVAYDSAGISSGMELTANGLTHGGLAQGASDGFGLIETRLKSDVRSLGFRVRFAPGESGSVALVGWQTSAVEGLSAGSAPLSGLRLLAINGSWTLSVYDGEEQVLAQGSFPAATGSVEFAVLRDGADLFVVDPTGAVTTATSAAARDLAGPWASWGLAETAPTQTPAVIESVWAG